MKNLFTCIILLLACCSLNAKVAYLPIIEPGFTHPSSDSISVLDLETGRIIKTLHVGHIDYNSSPIYLDDSGENLYISVENNKLVRIDTETLTIIEEWQDSTILSSIDKIFLSPDNSKLYYIILNVGTGMNGLKQLDLDSGVMSTVITIPDYSIQSVILSENSQYMTFVSYNHTLSQHQLTTFKVSDLSLKYETTIQSPMTVNIIDNEGENFYYRDSDQENFVSRKLSDATLNWTFSYPGETFYYSPIEKSGNELFVMGLENNYIINKNSGIGSPIPLAPSEEPVRLSGTVGQIDQDNYLNIQYPAIGCITGFCSLSSELAINSIDVETNDSELIFSSSPNYLGSAPNGRFIGENLYRGSGSATAVPLLNHIWQIMVFAFFIFIVAIIRLNCGAE